MTPTALAFMAQVDEYRRRHKGVDEEEAITKVRANGGVAVKPRRQIVSTTAVGAGWEDFLAQPAPQHTAPEIKLLPYQTTWEQRDTRIEWGHGHYAVIDMPRLLSDLGKHLGESPHIQVSAKDTWGKDHAQFRMTFPDWEIGLSFGPHGSQKVGVWAHLFDIKYHTVLGYVEINTATSIENMVRRVKKMLEEAEPKIKTTREEAAKREAAEKAFKARAISFAEKYPEFHWNSYPENPNEVSFDLRFTNGRRPIIEMDGRLYGRSINIRKCFVYLDDELFEAMMDLFRSHGVFTPEKE